MPTNFNLLLFSFLLMQATSLLADATPPTTTSSTPTTPSPTSSNSSSGNTVPITNLTTPPGLVIIFTFGNDSMNMAMDAGNSTSANVNGALPVLPNSTSLPPPPAIAAEPTPATATDIGYVGRKRRAAVYPIHNGPHTSTSTQVPSVSNTTSLGTTPTPQSTTTTSSMAGISNIASNNSSAKAMPSTKDGVSPAKQPAFASGKGAGGCPCGESASSIVTLDTAAGGNKTNEPEITVKTTATATENSGAGGLHGE